MCYSHIYRLEIPNLNIQISNNFQILKFNNPNILVIYLLFDAGLHVLNFEFRSLVFIWDLVFGACNFPDVN